MPKNATQLNSFGQNEQKRRARLNAARSADAGNSANEAFHDQTVAPIAQKPTAKQPREITSPEQEQSRSQDLKIQQRSANTAQQSEDLPPDNVQQPSSKKQNIKQQQNIAQNQHRLRSLVLSPRKEMKIRKQEKIIQKYDNSSFFLAYSIAIVVDTLDVLNAAMAPVPIVNFITIPLFTLISLSLRLYLSVFIWKRSNRLSRKIMRVSIIMILDAIPLLGILPMTVPVIYLLDRKMEKDAEEARDELEKLKK